MRTHYDPHRMRSPTTIAASGMWVQICTREYIPHRHLPAPFVAVDTGSVGPSCHPNLHDPKQTVRVSSCARCAEHDEVRTQCRPVQRRPVVYNALAHGLHKTPNHTLFIFDLQLRQSHLNRTSSCNPPNPCSMWIRTALFFFLFAILRCVLPYMKRYIH